MVAGVRGIVCSVPGYHFHFLSEDRQSSGHILDYEALEGPKSFSGCAMNEVHASLPETESFLKADLTRDLACRSGESRAESRGANLA